MGSVTVSRRSLLEDDLEKAHERYTLRRPISKKYHEEACLYMPGGNTRTVLHTTPFPLSIQSGKSCELLDSDNHKYIDFLGEYTAGIYGHSNPVIERAIKGAIERGWNYGGQHPAEMMLAKVVVERFPAIEKVRFVNSGTEANMLAIATAIAFSGRRKVLIFENSYHGSTIYGKDTTNKPSIKLPHEFVIAPYNDVGGTEAMIKSLPEGSLAAILVEPLLGSGGCYSGSPEFLEGLRRLATEQGAVLIFDEVMTSRLSYNGLGHKLGIRPDLMTLGKWVGGGMSFGAFGGRHEIMNMFDPRTGILQHPGTFNNNVFSMNAGIAGCNLLTIDRIDKLNANGEEMRSKLEEIIACHVGVGYIPDAPLTENMNNQDRRPPKMFMKGQGSLMAIHFAGPDKELLQSLLYHHLLEHGIYIAQRGFIALNIEIASSHIQEFCNAVESWANDYHSHLGWE